MYTVKLEGGGNMGVKLLCILGVICPVYGFIMTICERKLILTRKVVTGINSFTITVYCTIIGAMSLWQIKSNYIYTALYLLVIITVYILICIIVKKEEYPDGERFKKE